MDVDFIVGGFLFKMAIKIEKDDFMKMSVSPTRNTHFHSFGRCFWRSTSIKKRIGKRNGFWKAFLMDCAPFWRSFWTPKSIKNPYRNLIKFWIFLKTPPGASVTSKHTMRERLLRKGVPLGKGREGVEWYYYTELHWILFELVHWFCSSTL